MKIHSITISNWRDQKTKEESKDEDMAQNRKLKGCTQVLLIVLQPNKKSKILLYQTTAMFDIEVGQP